MQHREETPFLLDHKEDISSTGMTGWIAVIEIYSLDKCLLIQYNIKEKNVNLNV